MPLIYRLRQFHLAKIILRDGQASILVLIEVSVVA
jgi:hypothetical protein